MAQTAPRRTPPLTVEDYLCIEEQSSIKHEYVGGQLYALSGAAERHNRIVGNIFARLWTAARGGPCRVFGSDMRLRISDKAVYYPDVQVVCDPTDTEQSYKTSPCVIVEVLSPSTQSIDLREKLLAYRLIESLRAYVIVYQDQRRVMRHYRDNDAAWWDAELVGEGKVPFACPELELTLADIYEGLAPAG
ncbi:MAG TPA: Uma2 family endonuclease [Chloroflexota bacterium]|nr:Uma2 family endonuclease [Chloroflexota bacterium]